MAWLAQSLSALHSLQCSPRQLLQAIDPERIAPRGVGRAFALQPWLQALGGRACSSFASGLGRLFFLLLLLTLLLLVDAQRDAVVPHVPLPEGLGSWQCLAPESSKDFS